jgi:AP-4 complex subunit epsilon-1
LLYCASSVKAGFLAKDAFDFAFPHAINLVEAGKKLEEKRIGMFKCWFCTSMSNVTGICRLSLLFRAVAQGSRTSFDAGEHDTESE